MKRFRSAHLAKAAALIAITAAISAHRTPSTASAASTQYFAFITSKSSGQNAQIKTIIEDILKSATSKVGANIETLTFKDAESIGAALKGSKPPSIVLPMNYHDYRVLSTKYAFKPVISYSMYGIPKPEFCFFVKDNPKLKKASDLKGKNVVTYDEEFNYYLLRSMVGAPPDKFYSLSPIPDGASGIYALALDKADAAFVSDYIVQYLKMTNPGIVKNVRSLECSPGFTMPPAMISKAFPDKLAASIVSLLGGAGKDPVFKKYRQLMTMTKIKFVAVSASDFAAHDKLFIEADKKGWDKEFKRWSSK